MSSPIIKGRMSVMSNATLDRTFNVLDNSGWTDKAYKTKPAFIAKKITNEELFGETLALKPVPSELGQIQEKINEAEDMDNIESLNEIMEKVDHREPKNIFQTEKLTSSKFKEHDHGPSYHPAGKIVKHSIIGTTENFERYQRTLKRHIPLGESLLIISDKDNISFSEKSSMSRVLRPMGSMSEINSPALTRMASQTNFARMASQANFTRMASQANLGKVSSPSHLILRRNNAGDKKESKKDVRVSSEVLYKKIDEWRRRQKSSTESELKVNQRLPLEARILQTQETRILEKFDRIVNNWSDTIEGLNRRVDRKVGKPLMLKGEDYRKKREMAEAIHLAQNDQERLGRAYWKMSLRNHGITDERSENDTPLGSSIKAFNIAPQKPPSTLEIIRRSSKISTSKSTTSLPSIHELKNSLQSSTMNTSEFKYLDRTKNEYLMNKTMVLEEKLNKLRPPSIDLDHFNTFLVII